MTTIATDRAVRRLTAHIGAEISGIDLTQPLAGSDVEFINAALLEHKALVFRDAPLDDAGQQQFAESFGQLTTAHPTVPSVDGAPNVLPVDSEGGMPANRWHTDVTFVVNPPKASTLVSHVVAPYGGETLIANTAAAYRDLPEPLRAFAETLWAVHTNDHDYAVIPEDLDEQAKLRREIFTSTTFESLHPVVRVHPETCEKGLFLGGFATRLKGLTTSDSRDLIRIFQSYITRPENIVRVTWQPGQLVLFDNRITQHYAPDNYNREPRRLHRVTVAGDVPKSVSGESSTSLIGDASHYTVA
ncbi:TauD/TfdA dioxygenase family protein [Luteipulveratus mongoliensis]|uniref:Taurine dioxygenase n=1 Tax=Luteipulveratus mongoliensis TaxID=571913 RepID=A0A0K1JLL5_9MICO|nr:TauD/TfdA family dioxygenase [Luteipulveratus mongoliensis]AKU17614.1 taurine dioxygenase [Luteipulveratus mongoliensis]